MADTLPSAVTAPSPVSTRPGRGTLHAAECGCSGVLTRHYQPGVGRIMTHRPGLQMAEDLETWLLDQRT